MHVRTQQRPNNRARWGCGCLGVTFVMSILTLITIAVLIFTLPTLVLRIAGLEAQGDTETVFAEATPVPTLAFEATQRPPQQVSVSVPRTQSFNVDVQSVPVKLGTDNANTDVAQVRLDEAEILSLCQQYTDFCTSGSEIIRNAQVDLRAQGAIINAQLQIPETGIWQDVGIVVQVINGTQIDIMGLDVGGTLYAPQSGEVLRLFTEAEQLANEYLRTGTIAVGSQQFRLQSIQVDDNTLAVTFR